MAAEGEFCRSDHQKNPQSFPRYEAVSAIAAVKLNNSRNHLQRSYPGKVTREEGEKEEEEGNSTNIVEGLLEIVNMITDNPGLKTDLQEYFTESKRKGRSKKRWSSKCKYYLYLSRVLLQPESLKQTPGTCHWGLTSNVT